MPEVEGRRRAHALVRLLGCAVVGGALAVVAPRALVARAGGHA